jgi:hypothetical protein
MLVIHYNGDLNTEDTAMIGCIDKGDIRMLRQPCENRGLTLTHNADEQTATIGDRVFRMLREAEDFLITIPRIDFGPRFKGL